MSREPTPLDPKSIAVLEQIAEGRTYEQILARYPDLSYLDIFAAAREALTLLAEERSDYAARLQQIKRRHPRAYERWTEDEDATLSRLAKSGTPVGAIAQRFQCQPSAIRSRLAKLGLADDQ